MDKRLKIVIIDDEYDSVEVIESIINEKSDEYNVVATTTNPMDGIKLILEHKPDVVMLDIEMPQMNGFRLLEILGNFTFQLIFVTAYENYAVKAFKNNALDYILKPVSGDELFTALHKARNVIYEKELIKHNSDTSRNLSKRMVVPTISGYEFLEVEDIVRLEADGSYTKIVLCEKKSILVSKTLKEFESIIDSGDFFRTHRSHIINIYKINKYDKGTNKLKMIDGNDVPISRANLNEFKEVLGNNFIHIKYD